jgi:hypothetical protein
MDCRRRQAKGGRRQGEAGRKGAGGIPCKVGQAIRMEPHLAATRKSFRWKTFAHRDAEKTGFVGLRGRRAKTRA